MEQQRNVQATRLAVRHYWHQIKQDWHTSLPAFLLPGIGSILGIYVPPLIVARVLGRFEHGGSLTLHQMLPYMLLFVLTWGSGEILWRIGIQCLIITETKGLDRLYNNAMSYVLAKDISFFHDNFAGSLTKRVVGYCWKYVDLMDTLSFRVFASYLPSIFVVAVLWHYSPWIVLALVGLLAVTGSIVFPLIRRRQKLVAAREAAHNTVAGHIADTIGNMDTVKAFAHEQLELNTHREHVKSYVARAKASWDYQNLRIDVTTSPLYVIGNAVGLSLAILLGSHGIGSIQVIFITFSYFASLTTVVWNFNQIYRNIESAVTEASQFTALLLEEPLIKDPVRPAPFKVKKGVIKFEAVDFRYEENSEQYLFENFNLEIGSGEKVAFVGHSGGGKTTITRLLLRFMDIDNGSISIDGQSIAQVKQSNLREAIAYVPQEPAMFHRSLMDNIRYGRLDASDTEVKEAARLAHAEEFINELPRGYGMLVGERGVKLSGGQRQRVAIARAMLKNAPILILDEATSSLDSESEKYIQDALWKLMEGRTAIVIAHRLSTIQRMDRIVVLDEGQIVEQGTHKELLKAKGTYAKLWAHQSGGFLED